MATRAVEHSKDLLFALRPVRDVIVDQRRRIVDDRTVTREQPPRLKGADLAQRLQIRRQVAAATCGNDDRAARRARSPQRHRRSHPGADEEAAMIGRMTGRMHHAADIVAVGNPFVRDQRSLAGSELSHHEIWPSVAQRGHTADVIVVAVRDQHAVRAARPEAPRQPRRVLGAADAGVDERRLRPAAARCCCRWARSRRTVAGGNQDQRRQKKYFSRT